MKETIIQFGEGNFLRGFADYFIHKMNEAGLYDGKIVIVQPIAKGLANTINEQNGSYNLYLRGIENGHEVCEHTKVTSVSRAINPYEDFAAFTDLANNPDFRFIISNTTEAGIAFDDTCAFDDAPPSSFPGKLTQLLYRRFQKGLNGFVILSCELIDQNGAMLKQCVLQYAELWQLGAAFVEWIEKENHFCNTLVDRIVTGYPKDEAAAMCLELGYEDKLLDTAEIFHLWVIEGNFETELPLQKAGFHVIWTEDAAPYKKRKVRVLNGAHTAMVCAALLAGKQTVGECMDDPLMRTFLKKCVFDEILTVLGKTEENIAFANAVLERFENPYIQHQLSSIALNSVSKFAVRVLPTILEYRALTSACPKSLTFSLAALLTYYKTGAPNDSEDVIASIQTNDLTAILANKALWGCDLTDLLPAVQESYDKIQRDGIVEAIQWTL